MGNKNCENCKFWDIETDGDLGGPVECVYIGYCRVKSPTLVQGTSKQIFQSTCSGPDHSINIADYYAACHAVWPETRQQDWCGEFQHIERKLQ